MQSEDLKSLVVSHIVENEGSFSLRNILIVLFRHKWKIILVFIGAVVVTTMVMLRTQDVYESQAKLLIKPGRENISWDTTALVPDISFHRQNDLSAELAILTSSFVIGRVVEKIGPEALFGDSFRNTGRTPREEAARRVMWNLDVKTEKNNNIIYMSFTAQSPRLARDVLESVIDFYMERHIEVYQAQAMPKFFREQTKKLLAELRPKEEQLRQFFIKQGIVSMEGQQAAFFEQVNSFYMRIDDTNSQINSSQGKIAWLENNLKKRSETKEISRVTGKPNPVADTIKDRLINLRFNEIDLANRYPDDSRVLTDLRKQIRFAELELSKEEETNTELTTGIDANYETMKLELEKEQANLQALIARKQFLAEALEKRKANLIKLKEHQTVLVGLQREVDIARDTYRQYHDNYQRAKISNALDVGKISNVIIIQSATIPSAPNKSKKDAMSY